jgi:hypothetical protein
MLRTLGLLGIAIGLLAALPARGEDTIDLTEGWRFAPDPDGKGLDNGWARADFNDSSWATVRSGKRWEDQGFANVDGAAWYRKRVTVPATMRADRIWLVLGGLNDSGTIYCNGDRVGAFGDDKRKVSVSNTPIAVDLSSKLRWGQENLIAVQVIDWGNSGGIMGKVCALTTNRDSLPMRSLLRFVPGFEGKSSVVGLDVASLGMRDDVKVRFSAAVNGEAPRERDAALVLDHAGQALATATFDLAPKPGDRILLRATATGEGTPMVLERTYTWPAAPGWSGKYKKLRVLNNFVTELLSADRVPKDKKRYTFLNPREGWVFVRVQGGEASAATLDDEDQPLMWRKNPETGALEAMRHLAEGKHRLLLTGAEGAALDVRAVPELAFCYWPTRAVLTPLPPRDRAFAERYIFPVCNTLLTHNDMTDEEFNAWRAEGRQWLNNSSLPGLDDKEAPSADSVYQDWASNPVVTRPGYAGLIVDEFISQSPEHYAAWTAAIEKLYQNPGFKDKTFYAWVVETHEMEQGLALMRKLYALGGRFAWERYLHEEPTEEVAMLRLYDDLGALEEWGKQMPGLNERLVYCLGSFTTPSCSLNINPGTNYLPFMDRQFQTLATDPTFFGSRGVFQWAAHYADDDALRYAQALYRHYCIEGKRTPFRDFPYVLTHVDNPDFSKGLDGWRVEAAANGVTPGEYEGLGRIEGRWADVGDRCAVVVRSEQAPNRISQTLKKLEPGRLYSLKYIAGDLDRLGAKEEVGLWAELKDVDLVAERSFRHVMPSSFALKSKEFNSDHPAYTTYVQVMFRPKATTAELTFTDWKDNKPAGPKGQRIGFNFVEVMPYYE